jgi:hypothetical protein
LAALERASAVVIAEEHALAFEREEHLQRTMSHSDDAEQDTVRDFLVQLPCEFSMKQIVVLVQHKGGGSQCKLRVIALELLYAPAFHS